MGAADVRGRAAPNLDRIQGDTMTAHEAFPTTTTGPMAGLAFTGCELLAAAAGARAQAGPRRLAVVRGGRRREVVVAGRRAKVIDVHAHCVIKEAYDLLGLKVNDHRGPGIGEVGPRR